MQKFTVTLRAAAVAFAVFHLLGASGCDRNPVEPIGSMETASDEANIQTAPADRADTQPNGKAPVGVAAVTIPVAFASQNNPAWKCDQLGTCSATTMGTCTGKTPAGCAVTSIWMLANINRSLVQTPGNFNQWLKNNGGYSSGCLVIWSRAADWDGSAGLIWVGTDAINSTSQLKALIDQGRRMVAGSTRFASHWVALTGYTGNGTTWSDFTYFDPWDTSATVHRLGDGRVGQGRSLRVYRAG